MKDDPQTGQEQEQANTQPNEGEGNKTAAREYNQATEQYVRSGRVPKAADEAKRAVEGPEGKDLRSAEEAAKRGSSQA